MPEVDLTLELARKGNESKKFEEPHTCCLCQKVFFNRKTLKTHIKNVHKKAPPLFCDLCPKVYYDKVTLSDHMKVHREKAFACDLCDFKTVYTTDFKRHKEVHGPKQKCKKISKHQNIIKNFFHRHLLKNHNKQRIFECVCGRVYSTRSSFYRHKESHFEEKVRCEICYRIICGDGFERHWRLNHLKDRVPLKMERFSSKEKSK